MRKFKHQKTGDIAESYLGNPDYYKTENGSIIHKSFVENTKDWIEIFDEPEDKLYEVACKIIDELSSALDFNGHDYRNRVYIILKEQGLYTK